jgi:tryptophanyl-tRNA synthetase
MKISNSISEYFKPLRTKRAELEQNKSSVLEVLIEGEKKARIIAKQTMEEVRNSMKIG